MEEFLNFIGNISGLSVAGLAIFAMIIFLKKGGMKIINGNDITSIKTNHLPHIEELLREIKDKLEKSEDIHNEHTIILTRIFDRLNNAK